MAVEIAVDAWLEDDGRGRRLSPGFERGDRWVTASVTFVAETSTRTPPEQFDSLIAAVELTGASVRRIVVD